MIGTLVVVVVVGHGSGNVKDYFSERPFRPYLQGCMEVLGLRAGVQGSGVRLRLDQ